MARGMREQKANVDLETYSRRGPLIKRHATRKAVRVTTILLGIILRIVYP